MERVTLTDAQRYTLARLLLERHDQISQELARLADIPDRPIGYREKVERDENNARELAELFNPRFAVYVEVIR